jgi:hypothetical protein
MQQDLGIFIFVFVCEILSLCSLTAAAVYTVVGQFCSVQFYSIGVSYLAGSTAQYNSTSEVITAVWLNIQVFCEFTLCRWVKVRAFRNVTVPSFFFGVKESNVLHCLFYR